ncbi:sugar ABC transporter ATP-binding protein [Vibrio sonorensis]|uniref:sugar ABC transporter ATP-binding protein n=1 Tax=Vibrio sonorensis TaxID=1004316 RepID=UPI0008DAED7F|nr:sugar ABC transporter ATP-binding protein [Vibrio sonorensis]
MESYAIEATGISKAFDGTPVLKDVSFSLKKGEVHAIVGQNGAGKSTLVKILNGYHQRDSGKVKLFGREVAFTNTQQAHKLGIAMVYQDLSLVPTLSVADNLFLTGKSTKSFGLISNRERYQKALPVLELLGVDLDPGAQVDSLSVGQQQFVEIAKALAQDAQIIVLDEPTASLSNNEIQDLFRVINTLKSRGISIIYITHYLNDIITICDRVTALRDGYTVLEEDTKNTSVEALVEAMLGNRTQTNIEWERIATAQHTPLLELKNVSTVDIDSVSLKVMPGQVVGLAGLLGSGRTEVLEAIFGLTPTTSGEIWFEGQKANIRSPKDAIDLGINMVPEERRTQGLVLDFSVEDNVLMSSFDRITKGAVIDKPRGQSLVKTAVEKLGVKTTGIAQSVRFLSGGNQQKVVIGKCMSTDAKVLLLDDPTFGIDINAKYEIMKIVNQYVQQGNGVIFVSSEYGEIANFCDVIYIVNKGRVVRTLEEQSVGEEGLLAAVQ